MRFTIVSDLMPKGELPGRLRLRSLSYLTPTQATGVERALMALDCVSGARVSHRTGSILIHYAAGHRDAVLAAVLALSPGNAGDKRDRETCLDIERRLCLILFSHMIQNLFLPCWLHAPMDVLESVSCLGKATRKWGRIPWRVRDTDQRQPHEHK